MRKIGNLFTLAEKQLQKEKEQGQIPCYTMLDVIEYAVKIRKFLDDNPRKIKGLTQLTRTEKLKRHKESQKRYKMKARIR